MMTDLHAEALEYPKGHREDALELLLQKQVLDVQLHGTDERAKVLQQRAWIAGTRWTWVGVGIAAVAIFCLLTDLVDSNMTSLISACGLLVVLIALFVATRARQELNRITRWQGATAQIDLALTELRNGVENLDQWHDVVRSRISQSLDSRGFLDTKKDYLILILGSFILVWMLAFSLGLVPA